MFDLQRIIRSMDELSKTKLSDKEIASMMQRGCSLLLQCSINRRG